MAPVHRAEVSHKLPAPPAQHAPAYRLVPPVKQILQFRPRGDQLRVDAQDSSPSTHVIEQGIDMPLARLWIAGPRRASRSRQAVSSRSTASSRGRHR